MIRVNMRVKSDTITPKLRRMPAGMTKFVHGRMKTKTQQLVGELKRITPRKSGELRNAAYGRTYQKPLRAQIGFYNTVRGPTGFPYPLFVAGFVSIKPRPGNKFFMPGTTVRYGFNAQAPSGNNIKWSTQDPYWWYNFSAKLPRVYRATVARAVSDYLKQK